MKVGSFCSGFGGLDLAAHDLFNATTSWWSEIDSAAQKVMLTRFPDTHPVGDVTMLNPHDLEPVDIVTAGFPCQPFSTAGLRKGNKDERVIFQWIADAISIIRPRYVLLENVQGLLVRGGTDTVGALTAVGYDTRWGLVRASDAGAPHRRARWFAVAQPSDSHGFPARGFPGASFGKKKLDRRCEKSKSDRLEDGFRTNSPEWGEWGPAIRRWETILGRTAPAPFLDGKLNPWAVEWMMGLPNGWVCDVIDKRTLMLKMLGNGCVPQQAHLAFSLLLNK